MTIVRDTIIPKQYYTGHRMNRMEWLVALILSLALALMVTFASDGLNVRASHHAEIIAAQFATLAGDLWLGILPRVVFPPPPTICRSVWRCAI